VPRVDEYGDLLHMIDPGEFLGASFSTKDVHRAQLER
jgi:hypothetical protein